MSTFELFEPSFTPDVEELVDAPPAASVISSGVRGLSTRWAQDARPMADANAPPDSLRITSVEGGVRFWVLVAPRASREAVLGAHDGALKIALTAPPVDGEANAALVSFLAKKLGVAKRDVSITAGATSKRKALEVRGATIEGVRALLP